MSFAIPHPPSASSDSGSSASLTPTANGYTGASRPFADPSSSSSSAAPASGSLFSSEESKFITDSLSSAESFDPFTIGAPGFKVPSLLPPNIANTHDHMTSVSGVSNPAIPATGMLTDGMVPAASLPDGASGLDMRSRSLSGQQHPPYSTSSPGHPGADAYGTAAAAHRLNSFNLYGHRPGGSGTPPGSSPSYMSYFQDNHTYGHPTGRASFSGISNVGPLSPQAVAAGYGKNKAWQMEQLSFLEAQANRGHHAHLQNDFHRRSSTSMVGGTGPYDNLFFQTPPHLQHLQQNSPQQQSAHQQQQNRPPFYPGVAEESHGGLAMLGAQFPSSHNFGSMQQQQAYQQQQRARARSALGGGFSAQALATLNGDAGLGAASSLVDTDGGGGVSTPKGRTSRTPTEASTSKAGRASGAAAAWGDTSAASPSGSAGATGLKRTSSGAPKTAPTQSSSLHTGPSGAVIRALGDLANLDLNLEAGPHVLPPHLHPYFAPTKLDKRLQPHLEMLRQQHIDNGLIDPNTGLEIKPEPTEEDLKREAEEAEKEKKNGQHTLLTTEEKKANHIASEQKRRANIRKGYELLCDIVPSLKEALEREASSKKGGGGGGDDSGSDDDGSDDEKKGTKSPSKKKKAASTSKKDDTSGGIEIDGEKIDGRAGPRSEAVVLMKSLDHIGALVEQYRGLLGRRNRARLAVAKKFGWNDLPNQPVPDIDRLLAIKVQEWWAAHGDDEEEETVADAESRFLAREKEAASKAADGEAEEEEGKKAPSKGAKKAAAPKKKKAPKKDEGESMQD